MVAYEFDQHLPEFNLVGDDLNLLANVGTLIVPEIDAVLSEFYAHALNDADLAKYFKTEASVDHARMVQKAHWINLFSGRFDVDYFASVRRVGAIHAKIDLPLFAYVSAYSKATGRLLEALTRKAQVPPKRFRGARKADDRLGPMLSVLSRAFAFDMQCVVEVTIGIWRDEQQRLFDHMEVAVGALAEGNLGHVIPDPDNSDFPGRYDPMQRDFNATVARLAAIVRDIGASMEKLMYETESVTRAAQDLSGRTASQAASLEQTAAAMEELTVSVQGSAQNTRAAADVAREARQEVTRGAGVVSDAAKAMEMIKQSSDRISQITGVINDISFQTNLLALNAGGEAARAGDAGRGFAVVAQEVGALAAKSSQAAREIDQLISESAAHVASGVGLMDEAGSTLEGIVVSFERVSVLADEIASAAQEQSQGLGEVNLSVGQMDEITQKNAQMVEQTNDALHKLSLQAKDVQRLLGSLQIEPNSSASTGTGRGPSARGIAA